MFKVTKREQNVIYITPHSNIKKFKGGKVDTLVYDGPSSFDYSIDAEPLGSVYDCEEDDIDYDPLDGMIEALIEVNIDRVCIDDMNRAISLFETNMDERCSIIEYIEPRLCVAKISIGTPVGSSIINHSPVQCSDFEICYDVVAEDE